MTASLEDMSIFILQTFPEGLLCDVYTCMSINAYGYVYSI